MNEYEYTGSCKKVSSDKLPDRCKYFSYLKDEWDYSQATNILNTFERNTMDNYHDLYWKTDFLLLTDVFKEFIDTFLEYYGLDLCHYVSSLGLS